MDLKYGNITKILSIEHVELYQTWDHDRILDQKGVLYLLYAEKYDSYILQINDFNYALNKKQTIIASREEENSMRTYSFTKNDKNYIIKIIRILNVESLEKLEETMKHHSRFKYEGGGAYMNYDNIMELYGKIRGENGSSKPKREEENDDDYWANRRNYLMSDEYNKVNQYEQLDEDYRSEKIKRNTNKLKNVEEKNNEKSSTMMTNGMNGMKNAMSKSATVVSNGVNSAGTYIKTSIKKMNSNRMDPNVDNDYPQQEIQKKSMLSKAATATRTAAAYTVRGTVAAGKAIANTVSKVTGPKKNKENESDYGSQRPSDGYSNKPVSTNKKNYGASVMRTLKSIKLPFGKKNSEVNNNGGIRY